MATRRGGHPPAHAWRWPFRRRAWNRRMPATRPRADAGRRASDYRPGFLARLRGLHAGPLQTAFPQARPEDLRLA
jgi:hypothetical protein